MSIFKTSDKTETGGISEDRVGGSYGPLDTGIYNMVIDMAYLDQSQRGAYNVNFTFKDANGNELKQTIYVTNRDGETFYVKNGKQYDLPGYLVANSICLLATEDGIPLSELEPEEKTLQLWDYAAKAELPQKKKVYMDLIGKPIVLGVQKIRENKRVNDGSGNYVNTAEERFINEIDKAFRSSDRLTVSEIVQEKTSADFYEKWVAKNPADFVKDKYEPVDGTGAPAPAASGLSLAASNNTAPKAGNLFGKK